MKTHQYILLFGVWIVSIGLVQSEEDPIKGPAHDELDHLLSIVKPNPDERSWRKVNWITNVTEARQRGVAEDKPIIIFTAADGSPIGRT
ncbi:MAG: hypothetical protein ACON4R_09135 [Akkermansiaceae bacterium]